MPARSGATNSGRRHWTPGDARSPLRGRRGLGAQRERAGSEGVDAEAINVGVRPPEHRVNLTN
ncbi:hypothetical protein GCM10023317_85240 [Actinopolymorpha pittospori]|uniref:Uncharacterized protein n=1 Tax=Actinopolymorpha pittospori TaxID=648752 RepID=A0A927RHK8_9ACTN|nr:hypothetical protein [Actinopolymorpha pittospori]